MLHRIDPYRLRMEPGGKRLVPATVYLPHNLVVEADAATQLADAASIDSEAIVLATPDIHTGFGVPIGCVFASPNFISPSAVGYDINCGMRLLTSTFSATDIDPRHVAEVIRKRVPLGEGKANVSVRQGSLIQILEQGLGAIAHLSEEEHGLRQGLVEEELADDMSHAEESGSMPSDAGSVPSRALSRGVDQLGTLGGGNHFIEIQRVTTIDDPTTAQAWGLFEGQMVVMIHSGSRGLGHEIGGHYMKEAATVCKQQGLNMPNSQLAYMPLSSREGTRYINAMHCAANYAFANRQVMAQLVRASLRSIMGPDLPLPTLYDVSHNIAKFEKHHRQMMCVHRKGATRAFPGKLMTGTPFDQTGQPVLVPGSMGTASYILVGIESGHESLYSVNHGAGRRMSRTAASGVTKRGKVIRQGLISDQAFSTSMEGVHLLCEDRRAIKEEAPAAYKDIDDVIAAVVGAGLARVVARMVPLAVLKG